MQNFLSPIIISKVPSFLKENYKKFYNFLCHYFEFLETKGNPLEILETFLESSEVNNERLPYIDLILSELGFNINHELTISKSQLVLHLTDFYLNRGNEKSFLFLFKLLFNESISIDYPRNRMLIPSNTEYVKNTFIYTTANTIQSKEYADIINNLNISAIKVIGISTKIETLVEDIKPIFSKGRFYLKIQITKPLNDFNPREGVKIRCDELNIQIVEDVVPYIDFKVIDPGHSYKVGEIIKVDGTQIEGIVKIKSIENGSIQSLNIVSPGERYSIGDTAIYETNGTGYSFSAIVSQVDNLNNTLSVETTQNLNLNSENFTIELDVFRNRRNVEECLIDCGWSLSINRFNNLVFSWDETKSLQLISKQKVEKGKWYSVAVCRNGNKITLFINGIPNGHITSSNILSHSPFLLLGNNSSKNLFIGYIDEVRITKGMSRYHTYYNPSLTRFNSSDEHFQLVVLLVQFAGNIFDTSIVDSSSFGHSISTNFNIWVSSQENRFKTSGFFSGCGPIQKFEIYSSGYNFTSVPIIKIVSKFGTGANVEAESYNIGQIKQLELITPYIDAQDIQSLSYTILTQSGTGCVLELNLKTIFSDTPTWINDYGMLGINGILTDSHYFQQFSYEIKSKVSSNEYSPFVDSLLHPVGYIRFSIFENEYSAKLNENGIKTKFYIDSRSILETDSNILLNSYSLSFDLWNVLDKSLNSNSELYLMNDISNINNYKNSNNFLTPVSEYYSDNLVSITDKDTYFNEALDAEITI